MSLHCGLAFLLIASCLSVPAGAAVKVKAALFYKDNVPQTQFAAAEIRSALGSNSPGNNLDKLYTSRDNLRIALASDAGESSLIAAKSGLAPLHNIALQSYAIRVKHTAKQTMVAVLAADPVGAMYGGLDVAEAIRLKALDDIKDSDHSPYIERRGIKFNIPLDARTPSYSDAGDSAQQNIGEMWSFDFWRKFLDDMARDRFNVLTLWSLHPFPSMVKVPEYPNVALNDVKRTTIKFDDTYKTNGTDMVRPEILSNLVTIKRMTIDEKIRFWRRVMQYARDRGIEVYVFTWNMYVFGAEGKDGITSDQTNPVTIDYFRKSVREMFLTYPLLAGVGITAGENMIKGKGADPKEKWLWQTYGEGIRDVKKVQPDRDIRLIHRYHETSFNSIRKIWKNYPGTIDMSYKYAIAHMYSAPAPPFAKPVLAELPSDLRMWMTVRNDDIYSFRWGDLEFARDFVRALPGPGKMAGYYMGPDGYVWGREFISTEPETPRQLAIDKQWFPEACISRASYKGFYTVRDFIDGKTMEGSGILNIGDYCKAQLAGRSVTGTTPLQVADALQSYAKTTLSLTAELRPVKSYASIATKQYKPQLLTRIGYVDLSELTAKVEQDIEIAKK